MCVCVCYYNTKGQQGYEKIKRTPKIMAVKGIGLVTDRSITYLETIFCLSLLDFNMALVYMCVLSSAVLDILYC